MNAHATCSCSSNTALTTAIRMASLASGLCAGSSYAVVLASDTFSGASSADLGAAWDPNGQAFKLTAGGVGLAQASANIADTAERNNTVSWPDNQYVRVLFGDISTGSIISGYGVGLRMFLTGSVKTYLRFVASSSGYEFSQFIPALYTVFVSDPSVVFANADTLEVGLVSDGLVTRFFPKQNGIDFGPTQRHIQKDISSGAAGITHSSLTQNTTTVGIDRWEAGLFTSAVLSTVIKLVASASCTCSTVATFRNGIMGASAQGLCATVGSLTTVLRLVSSSTGNASCSAVLSTAIQLLGLAIGPCSTVGFLPYVFPTLGILDSFTRPNEGPPPSAQWTSSIIPGDTSLKIVSNAAVASAAAGSAYRNVEFIGPDLEVYVTGLVIAINSSIELHVRTRNPGTGSVSGYALILNRGSVTSTLSHVRITGASYTILSQFNITVTDGDSFGLSIRQNIMQAYYRIGAGLWNAVGASQPDGTYVAGGFVGLYSQSTSTQLTNFGGGTLGVISVNVSGICSTGARFQVPYSASTGGLCALAVEPIVDEAGLPIPSEADTDGTNVLLTELGRVITLSTAITLASAPSGHTSTAAVMSGLIIISASATGTCSTAARLVPVTFNAVATGLVSTSGALTTAIRVSARTSLSTTVGLIGTTVLIMAEDETFILEEADTNGTAFILSESLLLDLTTAIQMKSNASGICSTTSSLVDFISHPQMTGAVICPCSTTASFTTSIRIAASAVGLCSSTVGLVTVIPLIASSSGTCSISSSLTTAITNMATSAGVCSCSAILDSSIRLASTLTGLCSVIASLSTVQSLAASSSVACSSSASLTTALSAVGAVNLLCTVSADLTTAILLAAQASGVCVVSGIFQERINAVAFCSCSVIATLTPTFDRQLTSAGASTNGSLATGITGACAASAICSTSVSLATSISFIGSAVGVCSTSVSLTNGIGLAASAGGSCSSENMFVTVILIAGTVMGVCNTACDLLVQATLACSSSTSSTGTADLQTAITMAAIALATCSTATDLELIPANSFSSTNAIGRCSTSVSLTVPFDPIIILMATTRPTSLLADERVYIIDAEPVGAAP